MIRKGLIFLFALLLVVMAGCSSTNPSLKDMWLESIDLAGEPYEVEQKVHFSTSLGSDELDPIAKEILALLESGIILRQKQNGTEELYLSMELENPDFIKDSEFWQEYWTHENDPKGEMYINGTEGYLKTSSEEVWIRFIDDAVLEGSMMGSPQDMIKAQQDFQQFYLQSMKDFAKGFDIELRDVEKVGTEYVQTDHGKVRTTHLRVNMDLNDIREFSIAILDGLIGYEKLDQLAAEYLQLMYGAGQLPEELSEEQIQQAMEELRVVLHQLRMMADVYMTEENIAEMTGMKPVINLTLDYYVTNKAEWVKQVMNIDLLLEPVTLPDSAESMDEGMAMLSEPMIDEPASFNLNVESILHQRGKADFSDIDVSESVSMAELLQSRENLDQLNENSFMRKMLIKEFNRVGEVRIGDEFANINGNYKFYEEAAPYIAGEGHTLVPIRVITDIAGTEPNWNPDTREVTFQVNQNVVVVQIGSTTAYVNGDPMEMPVAPEIKNDRSFVPLRFITENLGAIVDYDAETQTITIRFEAE